MINVVIDNYIQRHSIVFDFFDFSDSFDFIDFQNENDYDNIDNVENNSRWNVVDLDFFDSMHENKFVHTNDFIQQIEKNIYFKNVHHFIRRVNDIITIKKVELIRQNLWICLRKTVLSWWTIEFTNNEKLMTIFIVETDDKLKQWTRLLHDRFKTSFNIILNALLNERYTMRDAVNRREFRKYAQKILLLIKNANLNSAKNQLNVIYNDIDSSLRKNDVKRSKVDDTINNMLELLNDCKHDWWNYEVKTMREQNRSQSQTQKFTQNDQYDFNRDSNQSNFQRRSFFNQYKSNVYFNNQYNQKFDNQNRYLNYSNSDYQNNNYDYQQNQYDQSNQYDDNRFQNVVDFSSSSRLQIIADPNSMINSTNDQSNASNSFMTNNQKQSFRSRLNQDENNQSRFNNNERFDKTQSTYQTNVENEKKRNENVDKNSNSYYHEKNNENENWTENAEFYTDDSWSYNEEFDVNFVTSASMMSAIHVCQKCSTKFIFKNKLFKHLRVECWQFDAKSNAKFDANHVSVTSNAEKSIVVDVNDFQLVEFIVTSITDNDYVFRKSHYVTTLIKETRDEKIVSCCLNIECSFTVENRIYVKRTFFSTSIRQLIVSLSVRDIDNNIHNFSEYVVVDLFMNDHVVKTEKKNSATNRFSAEIHIVDELKINLLIDNDVFNAQRVSLDLKIQIATLISCSNLEIFIDITAKKNADQRRTIRFKINFKISAEVIVQMSISYHDSLSNDRDFFFEFQCNQLLDLNEDVFAYIVDAFLNHVMIRNIIQHSVILQKRVRLKTLIDYNQQKCYNLTSDVDFLVIDDWKISKQHQRIWKSKLNMTAAAVIYVVFLATDMTSFSSSSFKSDATTNVNFVFINLKTAFFIVIDSTLKHVMSNDVTIYDESNAIARIAKMINAYSSIWNDQDTIVDISENQWMSITLKSNAENLKSIRIYSAEFKNRAIIDAIFDKMHKKNKMTWSTQLTSFSFSTFVI